MASSAPVTEASFIGAPPGEWLASGSRELLEELRRDFSRQHYVRLPGFFGPKLLEATASEVAKAEFTTREHEGIGAESCMKPNMLAAALSWLVNGPALVRAIQTITADDDIGYFVGRIYRMDPSSGQAFDWHDDCHNDRRLALTVNVGERPYTGGVLQLRERSAPDAIAEVPNVGRGDAILFQVAAHLMHRVTPVEGTVPKLAFTGWFRPGADYYTQLRDECELGLPAPTGDVG